eukprot:Tbor_TRINITY_DN3427_c0_g1::TRINITY_DN3427_c0_g1_i1::g.3758::m.3758
MSNTNDLNLPQGPFPEGEEFRSNVSDIMRHEGIHNITMKGMRKRLEAIYRIDFTPHKEKLASLVTEICQTPEFKKTIGRIAKQEKEGVVSKGTKKKKDKEKDVSSKKEKKKSEPKEKKEKKPDNYPKAPMTSYFLFLADIRKKIADENPGMAHKDQTRKAGELYNSLSKEDRDKYDAKAAKDKIRFQKEMDEYKANGGELIKRGSKTKHGKKEKKERDPNLPKAPLTSYFIFLKEARPKALEALGNSKDVIAISKHIKVMWDALTADERAVLDKKASEDKERYKRECEEKGITLKASKTTNNIPKDKATKRPRDDSPPKSSSSSDGSSSDGSGSSSSSSSDSDSD